MKRWTFRLILTASIALYCGCGQNAGSGSSGDSVRTSAPSQQPADVPHSPSNVEQGQPPGSHRDGNGPVPGTPAAGTNPGAGRNGESAVPHGGSGPKQ